MDDSMMRLASWDEIRAHITTKYPTTEAANGELHVTVGAARSPIQLKPCAVYGRTWLEIVGVLNRNLRSIPPTPVLTRNFTIPVGVLGMSNGNLLLRQLLPLEGLRAVDLVEALQEVAQVVVEAQ